MNAESHCERDPHKTDDEYLLDYYLLEENYDKLLLMLDSQQNSDPECAKSQHVSLVIGEFAFSACENLQQIIFDNGSNVEEIQFKAFYRSGLESFVAPSSLRKIAPMAFGECHALRDFQLNEDIQELGWLCLWGTGITMLKLPSHIERTPEQLGVGQDGKILCLPDGLETVGNEWFR